MSNPTSEEIRLFELKRAQRKANREQFIKTLYNPCGRDIREGGLFFDPGALRQGATSVKSFEYYKVAPKTLRTAILFAIPIGIVMYFNEKSRNANEHAIRTGQVPYTNRSRLGNKYFVKTQ